MSSAGCVIVGGGHVAAQLSPMLRQRGWDAPITVISNESYLPYQRPALSKGFLSSELNIEDLIIKPEDLYKKLDINILLNTNVTKIDRTKRRLFLGNDEQLDYEKLVLATGAANRPLLIPGARSSNIFYIRKIDDVLAIRPRLKRGRKVVIIGGGYVGLETAAILTKLGLVVTILEAMPRILQRVTSTEVASFFTRIHTEEGVSINTGKTPAALHEDEKGLISVHCDDGSIFPADLVIVGIGVLPVTQLAEEAGLSVKNGVVVDEHAQTDDADILAAGDCTWHFNKIYKTHIRLESVQNAVDQASIAVNTLCGNLAPNVAVPWFWSDQYDIKLQIAGLSHGYNNVVIRGNSRSGRSFAVFYFSDNRLLAVDAINRPREFMVGKRLVANATRVAKDLLADEHKPMTEFLN